MIIAISGKMRSGKDTVTKILLDLFERRDVRLSHFKLSEPLYDELKLFCEKHNLKYTKNRRFLEGVGQLLNENYEGGDKLVEIFDDKYFNNDNYIVSDMRRLTQYNYFKDKNAYLIRVEANDEIRRLRCTNEQEFATNHITDIELDNADYFNFTISNNFSLKDLSIQCEIVVNYIMEEQNA